MLSTRNSPDGPSIVAPPGTLVMLKIDVPVKASYAYQLPDPAPKIPPLEAVEDISTGGHTPCWLGSSASYMYAKLNAFMVGLVQSVCPVCRSTQVVAPYPCEPVPPGTLDQPIGLV